MLFGRLACAEQPISALAGFGIHFPGIEAVRGGIPGFEFSDHNPPAVVTEIGALLDEPGANRNVADRCAS